MSSMLEPCNGLQTTVVCLVAALHPSALQGLAHQFGFSCGLDLGIVKLFLFFHFGLQRHFGKKKAADIHHSWPKNTFFHPQ